MLNYVKGNTNALQIYSVRVMEAYNLVTVHEWLNI